MALLVAAPTAAPAEIRFEETTKQAGLTHSGPSAGAAWGDVNGDRWPDLWVTNHQGDPPTIYLNQRDGTFSDVTARALPVLPVADLHGAAWADFDNDGDQDLLAQAGGGAGRGSSPNHLFVNEGGVLRDEGEPRGLSYPLGRGRTPLWLDADRDGNLDVLLTNYRRPDGRAPSAVFRQTGQRFEEQNREFGFRHGGRTRVEKWHDRLGDLTGWRLGWLTRMRASDFAQLADLAGDGRLELIVYSRRTRIYSLNSVPFEEITSRFEWPVVDHVQDAAVGDFDGDGRPDLVVARGVYWVSAVEQTDTDELVGFLTKSSDPASPGAVRFRTEGELTLQLHPPWQDPSDPRGLPAVWVGSERRAPGQLAFRLSREDAAALAARAPDPLPDRSVAIDWDSSAGEWTLRSTLPRLTFVVGSTQRIREVRTIGFESSGGEEVNALLWTRVGEFELEPLGGAASGAESCRSAAAGDFDNDMDVDVYLVCSSPLGNRPNRLYENDGRGGFRRVADAGGAAGSDLGRGDVVATADYDGDGFLDLFVANGWGPPPLCDGPHQLFRNAGNDNHWIEIDLEGVRSNRDGVGASLRLEAGGVTQLRGQGGGIHSFAQNHARIHFGLGAARTVDRLTVRWPSGVLQSLEAVDADQILRLREPAAADPEGNPLR